MKLFKNQSQNLKSLKKILTSALQLRRELARFSLEKEEKMRLRNLCQIL
jgi:hydrogenase maturation factor